MGAAAYAVDQTAAFHIALYVLAMETLLFFAVVMHSQTFEPTLHPGVARHFGLLFLFQAASALLMVVAEQTYPSGVSKTFALLTIVTIASAVCMSVPAALVVAYPEGAETPSPSQRTTVAVMFVALLSICIFALPGGSAAVLDLPYVPRLVRSKTLGAMAGAAVVLAAASCVRMARGLKGSNGALVLAAAVGVLSMFGLLWAALEPSCRTIAGEEFPESRCPLPSAFDHNVLVTVMMIVCNALAAEGVLRLMQAGDGGQQTGYIQIHV